MKVEKCKNCAFYTAYYKQWASGYDRLNNGFCSKHQEARTRFEFCGEFKSNAQKEKSRDKLRLERLDLALQAVIEIAQILKEKETGREP